MRIPKRVLVCGGRDYTDENHLSRVLSEFNRDMGIYVLIHGAAPGADTLAGKWAARNGVPVRSFKAQWARYGRAAGAIRNKQMLEEAKPEVVIAFPGGKGTADMVRKAHKASVPVLYALGGPDARQP